jgi:GT2 family glycosyltransferase
MRSRAPVAVVIVNWNAGDYLDRCLAGLDRQTCEPDEVIVVDNASEDGSAEGIEQRHRGVRTIRLTENTGFAAACNVAARAVRASTWIATLNPDAVPDPDWLASLMDAVDRMPDCVSFGCQLIVADAPDLLDGTGDIYHVSGLAWRRHHYAPVSAEALAEGEIFAPCAAAALYRLDAFVAAGGFDERYFCYFEDVDLGFRLRLFGHRSWYVPEARVRHAVSALTRRGSAFYVYHGQRNMVWTYVKNMPAPLFWLYAPQHVLATVVALGWFSFRGLGWITLKAKLHSLRALPDVWRQRREIQRRRRVPARELRRMMAGGLLAPYVRRRPLHR